MNDRAELLAEVEALVGQAISRLERLSRHESAPKRRDWQQAAKLARRIRGLARDAQDEDRRRAKLDRVREAMRS